MAGKSKSKVSAGAAAQANTPPINNTNSSMNSGHGGVISGGMMMGNNICQLGVAESNLCQGQIYPPQVQNPSYGQVYSSTTFQISEILPKMNIYPAKVKDTIYSNNKGNSQIFIRKQWVMHLRQ